MLLPALGSDLYHSKQARCCLPLPYSCNAHLLSVS